MTTSPSEPEKPTVTARMIARTPAFMDACKEKGVEPTVRQARKYRRKEGRWKV